VLGLSLKSRNEVGPIRVDFEGCQFTSMKENWENHWKDYYQILQVHTSAEPEFITIMYKKLLDKYHPDHNPGKERWATEKSKEINEAYEILGNTEKRKRYNLEYFRRMGKSGPDIPPPPPPAKPKPEVNPTIIRFLDVVPGEIRKDTFIVKNSGGPYLKIWLSNTNSWLNIVNQKPLYGTGKLPLFVEIEVKGDDWGKSYVDNIIIKLDDIETHVRVELTTRPKIEPSNQPPPVEKTNPPTSGSGTRTKRGRGLLVFACISVIIVVIAGVFLANSNRSKVPIQSSSSSPITYKPSITLSFALSGITVQKSSNSEHVVKIGSTIQFIAMGDYNGSTADVSSQVTWATSNKGVATISSEGLVTCVGNGTAYISATMEGITGLPVTLTVPVTLSSISLILSGPFILGSHVACGATAHYSDGSVMGINSQAIWTSSNTAIATVSPAGLATLIAVGTTNITATLDGISITEPLTVRLAK
jgi:DnaJ domain/Bacterial Ig-like domain (group 2)